MKWAVDGDDNHDWFYEEGRHLASKPIVIEVSGRYSFEDEDALVRSSFFQNALLKSLAFKDKEIIALQNELLKVRQGWDE